uniref:Uncharacterized protein n=1 Tax=Tanacetum cinerariifolium TaxID=118510 RepID=A0A6L2KJZ2_TANCI|nr:hypothetical protein [Tanacetum cinerariifolium]
MQKGFLSSGGGRGNHKKKDGSQAGISSSAVQIDVTNAHTISIGGSKVNASFINPTCGGTEVTDTTYNMNNSNAINSTSSTTLPNANMSGLADTGVTGFTLMLNTNATRDVVTIPGQSGIHSVISTRPIPYISVVSVSPSKNGSSTKNGGDQVGNEHVNKFPSSYATKLSLTSSTMAYLRKLEVKEPTDSDYDVWLPLTSVHKVNN